ncbi:MAG: DUF1573 domain-containing protein [Tannerella sp.]|jgi:hypothetical protein|nr:DUF1573 domain-containing protein [Tannerella sp.]
MKRILFVCITVLLTSAGTVFAQQKEASITVADSAMFDFGDINEADGPVSHTFTVINNGELPLVISRVVPSCGCTSPEWTKEPIPPGKTGAIKATFNPAGVRNNFTKTINVYSNGKSGRSYTLTIKGNVIPKQS